MAVVSVDLAYTHYQNIGIALLRSEQRTIACEFIRPGSPGLSGTPAIQPLAQALDKLCSDCAARLNHVPSSPTFAYVAVAFYRICVAVCPSI